MELITLDLIFRNKAQSFFIFILFYAIFKSIYLTSLSFSLLIFIFYMIKIPQKKTISPFFLNVDEEDPDIYVPSIYAHRGAGVDAPENTLSAVKLAKENGAEGIEFDVDFTSDGECVVIHDDTVDRTTNGTGNIHEMTLEQIRKFNTSKSPGKFEPIPTIEEMVNLCLKLDLKMLIDVKEYSDVFMASSKITSLFSKYPQLYDRAAVCSFFPHIIYFIKLKDNNIITGLTHRPNFLSRKVDGTEKNGTWYMKLLCPILDVILQWGHSTFLWYLCQNHLFLMCREIVCSSELKFLKERDIEVIVWTVNADEQKNYLMNNLKTSYMTDTLM